MKPKATDLQQEELALSSVRAHVLFPGRTSLYPMEVAKALEMTLRQVLDLIEEYELTGGRSGLAAVNIGSGTRTVAFPKGSISSRKYWRIPVSAYDAFVEARKNSQTTTTHQTTTTTPL